MLIVKDSTVLIHLAKTSLLEMSCGYFKAVIIPRLVYQEVMRGLSRGYSDAKVVEEAVTNKKLTVMNIKSTELVKRANEFNIQGGEAEAVALYWQEKADFLATDDDNVRRKGVLIGIKILGTPAIVLKLRGEKLIDDGKFEKTISELRKIGWFSNAVLDKVLMEGAK